MLSSKANARKSNNKYNNNYIYKDIKEEKKKYPIIKEEDKLKPDKVNTNSNSKSIYLFYIF
ncbi:unnamed protein product [Fusarium fujikuroi]|nr:unnamed protein product [Fusarium fujikuroi]